MKVSIKVLPTVLLDVKIDDNMVLRDFHIVSLMSVNVLESGMNVLPSVLRSIVRSCLLSGALCEESVEQDSV